MGNQLKQNLGLEIFVDLTFGPSFKVKRWFTEFGELSFDGYKFASVLRCVGLVNISTTFVHKM